MEYAVKTREQILEAVTNGRKSECIDGRDYSRLVEFFPVEDWDKFGFSLKSNAKKPEIFELTENNVIKRMEGDVAFGFEKALNKRGISSGLMFAVVKMWLWVLDDPLQDFENYSMYGLPLFKAVAIKYRFDNPIGEDSGSEDKYEDY